MTQRLPVVVLTTFFPNPRLPHRTVFVRNLVAAMQASCDVTVVAPVPMRPQIGPWRDEAPVPAAEQHDGFTLLHPRFLSIPGLHLFAGLAFALAAWPVLRQLRKSRGEFVVHAHCAYPDAVGAAIAARLVGVPLVVTVHGSDINQVAERPTLKPQIRWALRGAERVIAVSQALAARVKSLTGLTDKVVCIPCAGHASDVFRPRGKTALRNGLSVSVDGKLVVFVGQWVAVKALDVLLQAWAHVRPDARLALIGAGPRGDSLKQLARELGIDQRVSFVGALPQAEVADWMAAADVLCLPSHSEGMPNVIVEALACGVPVVASRVGGIPELIEVGRNGLLVSAGDVQGLAAALNTALQRNWSVDDIVDSVRGLTWNSLAERNHQVLRAAMNPTPIEVPHAKSA